MQYFIDFPISLFLNFRGDLVYNIFSMLLYYIVFFSRDLKELLKLVQWPFIHAKGPNKIPIPKANNETPNPEDPNVRLESVIGNLLSIQLPLVILSLN